MRIRAISAVLPVVASLALASPAVAHTHRLHHHRGLPASLVQFMRAHPGGHLAIAGMRLSSRPGAAHPATSVTGNCGQSFLYISNASGIGHGWIQEYAGVSLDYPLLGGSGTISWSNTSTGGHNAYLWSFGGNINGNAHIVRNAYTHVGWIYAVMYASAVVLAPFPTTCTTPYGQPWSTTYAS